MIFFKHLCRKAFYTSIAHFFDSRRKLVDEAYKTIPQLIYEDRERLVQTRGERRREEGPKPRIRNQCTVHSERAELERNRGRIATHPNSK